MRLSGDKSSFASSKLISSGKGNTNFPSIIFNFSESLYHSSPFLVNLIVFAPFGNVTVIPVTPPIAWLIFSTSVVASSSANLCWLSLLLLFLSFSITFFFSLTGSVKPVSSSGIEIKRFLPWFLLVLFPCTPSVCIVSTVGALGFVESI